MTMTKTTREANLAVADSAIHPIMTEAEKDEKNRCREDVQPNQNAGHLSVEAPCADAFAVNRNAMQPSFE